MSCHSPLAPKLHVSPWQQGFTLIELMLGVVIMGFISVIFLSVVLWQAQTFYGRLAEIDTNQSAQTIINSLQLRGNQAGFGFGHGAHATGRFAVGQCLAQITNDAYAAPASNCTKVDNNGTSDRLRFSFIDPWQYLVTQSASPSGGPCPGGSGADPLSIHLPPNAGYSSSTYGTHSFGFGVFNMYIGGDCVGGGSATSQIAFPSPDLSPGDGCVERRPYTLTTDTSTYPYLHCAQGYERGFTLGNAQTSDFYTFLDPNTNTMQLNMNEQAWGPYRWPLAQGVTRFEVRYAIDLSAVPDGLLDPWPTCTEDPTGSSMGGPYAWCRDLRAADMGGPCRLTLDSGQDITTRELYNRVIAINVTFDLTKQLRPGGYIGHAMMSDPNETRTYQATVRLRNAQP